MFYVFTFAELQACDQLAKKIAKDLKEVLPTKDATISSLRAMAIKDPRITVDNDKQIVMVEVPSRLLVGVAHVMTKHYDSIVPVMKSLIGLMQNLKPLVKDFIKDMKALEALK